MFLCCAVFMLDGEKVCHFLTTLQKSFELNFKNAVMKMK